MKFIKKNSAVIVFYLLIVVGCLALAYNNQIEDKKMSANETGIYLAD